MYSISPETRFRLTKWIVISSVFFSFFKLFTDKMGWNIPYPFTSWKLYTQPYGWENTASQYRIYANKHEGGTFERIPVQATLSFTPDEYIYTLNSLVNKSLNNVPGSRNKLLIFAMHVEPNYYKYKIVKETFVPTELLVSPEKFDTTSFLLLN